MYPKLPTFTMKLIAAGGMRKTIFFIAFFHSLANKGILKQDNIYTFCPTFNEQDQWRSARFIAKNFTYLNEEYAKGK